MSPQTLVANDTRLLVALFRTSLGDLPHNRTPKGFSAALRGLSDLLRDTGPAGGYLQHYVEEHGPQAVLRALVFAYDHPEPVLVYEQEYP
jgi:hypothetical protein